MTAFFTLFKLATSPLGRIVSVGLLVLGISTYIYTKGYRDGSSSKQREWDAAEQRAIERGNDVRRDAENEIPPVVEAPPVAGDPVPVPRRAPPRWMRDDRYNRDNR